MRLLITILLTILIYSANFCSVNSQSAFYWKAEKKLTEKFFDTNPHFMVSMYYQYSLTHTIESLIFERRTTGMDSVSRICIAKIDTSGIMGDPIYISSGEFDDRNPFVFEDYTNNYAFGVWESQRISGSHIVGCFYSFDEGWHDPFIIDSSSDCHNPYTISNGENYSVVFESSGDIIYTEVDGATGIVSYYFNLTSQDTSYCNIPKLSCNINSLKSQVTYQRRNSDNTFSINKRSLYNGNIWNDPSAISTGGDNRNSGYILSYTDDTPLFESNISGKWNIYSPMGTLQNINDSADNTSLARFFDNRVTLEGYLYTQAAAYKEYFMNQNRIILSNYYFPKDTVMLNENADNTTVTINNGLSYHNYDYLIWVIYNKDSSGNSSLFGKSVRVINTGISESGNHVPNEFSLLQNYPNPFNPSTVIRYSLSENRFVTLKLYDVRGNEIATLINEKQNRGTYNYQLSTVNYQLSSGVYFYRLESGDFSETKRMLLLK